MDVFEELLAKDELLLMDKLLEHGLKNTTVDEFEYMKKNNTAKVVCNIALDDSNRLCCNALFENNLCRLVLYVFGGMNEKFLERYKGNFKSGKFWGIEKEYDMDSVEKRMNAILDGQTNIYDYIGGYDIDYVLKKTEKHENVVKKDKKRKRTRGM